MRNASRFLPRGAAPRTRARLVIGFYRNLVLCEMSRELSALV